MLTTKAEETNELDLVVLRVLRQASNLTTDTYQQEFIIPTQQAYNYLEQFENGIYTLINPMSNNSGTIFFAQISERATYLHI